MDEEGRPRSSSRPKIAALMLFVLQNYQLSTETVTCAGFGQSHRSRNAGRYKILRQGIRRKSILVNRRLSLMWPEPLARSSPNERTRSRPREKALLPWRSCSSLSSTLRAVALGLTLSNDCKDQHILFRSNELAYNIRKKK